MPKVTKARGRVEGVRAGVGIQIRLCLLVMVMPCHLSEDYGVITPAQSVILASLPLLVTALLYSLWFA